MTGILPLFGPDPEPEARDERQIASAKPDPSALSGASTVALSVGELTEQIREILEGTFSGVTVVGEVSNVSRPRSGHLYFKIKDESAEIRAVLWRGQASRIPFDLEDGLAVRATGQIAVYAKRGEYQISVEQLVPEGIGPLELAFRQLVERLRAEGLFDEVRKRPLPRFPETIAVVTSPTGAAIQDITQTLRNRWPVGEVVVIPAKVQGEGSAEQIASAIARANQLAGVDLLIVGRGGGSLEDLWAFNEETVARAIAASLVPVVSGVGHEVDTTIADLVADRRALTPTDAAVLSTPDREQVRDAVGDLTDRLIARWQARFEQTRDHHQSLRQRLVSAIEDRIETARRDHARRAAQLDALSPLRVLGRGYSLTARQVDGTIVRSCHDVRPRQILVTRLAEGRIRSRVVDVEEDQPRASESDRPTTTTLNNAGSPTSN